MKLVLLFLLVVAEGLATTPALIAHTCKNTGSASSLPSSSIDTTGANFIIIAVGSTSTANAVTPTDSRSNSYTPVTLYTDPNGAPNNTIQFFYVSSPAVGATVFTITVAGGGTTSMSLCVEAWSFIQISSPVEASNGTEIDHATPVQQVSPGAVTPTLPFSLIIGAAHISNNGGTAEVYSISDTLGCGSVPSGGPFFTVDDQVSSGTAIGMAIAHCQEQVSIIAENPLFQLTMSLPGSWVGAVLVALAPLPATPMPHVN